MKKSRKSHAPHTPQPRPLDDAALTGATGAGGERPPVPAWTPEQHNEAFVRARPRRRRR